MKPIPTLFQKPLRSFRFPYLPSDWPKDDSPPLSPSIRRPELDERPIKDLMQKYESLYLPKLTTPSDAWTATSPSDPCDPGVHSAVDRTDALNRLRYFRWLVGIPSTVSIDDSANGAQAAAIASTQMNDDSPPSSSRNRPHWKQSAFDSHVTCSAGAITSSGSIDLYMDDTATPSLNRRRSLLNCGATAFALWQTRRCVALRVNGVPTEVESTGHKLPPSVPFVAYPPGGLSLLDRARVDWSFEKPPITVIDALEIKRSDGLVVRATPVLTGANGRSTVRIVLSNPGEDIVAGHGYRVRLTADGEQFEWFPYFVTHSAAGKWGGASPPLFADSPTATPVVQYVPVVAASNESTTIPSDATAVELSGAGVVVGQSASVAHVAVAAGANITAQSLTVAESLLLRGDARLAAAPGTVVGLSDHVDVHFALQSGAAAFLNIGAAAAVVPRSFAVDGTFGDEAFERAIVVAENFSNCEEWVARAVLASDRARVVCRALPPDPRGVVLAFTADGAAQKSFPWVLVGAIGGCTLVFIILLVAICCGLRERRSRSDDKDILRAHLNV
jgi:hypothetical protein